MKRTVLFGAGQVGAMIARLLGPEYEALCFADNSEKKWGAVCRGLTVLPPEKALALGPACVCLCVMDAVRAGEMERQLSALGFSGEVLRPELLAAFDARAAVLRLLAEQIAELGIAGDAAELGVYRGDFARLINAALPDRPLHLFDTFEGFAAADIAVERREGLSRARAGDFSDTGVEAVRRSLPHPERAVFHRGWFPESFAGCEGLSFALVSLDADLYAPTAAALERFWPRLDPGGAIIIHDVNGTQYPGAGRAVREFCGAQGLLPMPVCDLHGSVVLRKPLRRG